MQLSVISIFPELFSSFLDTSLIKRARKAEQISINIINPRSFAQPPHFQVDDTPYGGGAGMVMKVEPVVAAIRHTRSVTPKAPVIYLTPAGERFNQRIAEELSQLPALTLLCGRYEGIDQRAIDLEVDREISIGDYVLMGGEIPAMVIIEAVTRLLPGVLGNSDSLATESFNGGSHEIEAPCYTRPPEFEGQSVPEVLLSGDHQKINRWRMEQSAERTLKRSQELAQKEASVLTQEKK